RQTRIRVSVLGDQVRATILPPDSTSARQLEQRMDELQAALVRQGFTDAKVSVQAGRGEGALPWGASQAVAPNELRSSSGTDQPPGDQRQGTGRRDGERQGDGQRHPHQRPRERDPNDRRRN
ncbi:MAG TPA: flagellar hook-length control protein FliK, partial [Gemmatimonadales bacterium]|nr:flagellar hook-length control protein FliK [Gemmatimonadales bacterium]